MQPTEQCAISNGIPRSDSYRTAMSNLAAYCVPPVCPGRTLIVSTLHGCTWKFMDKGQCEKTSDPGKRHVTGEGQGDYGLIMYTNGMYLHHPRCVGAVMMLPADQDPKEDTCHYFHLTKEELSMLDSMGHIGNCCLQRNSNGKLSL